MIVVSRVGPDQYDAPVAGGVASAGPTLAESLLSAVEGTTDEDGRPALNEATLLSLRHHGLAGKTLWVARDEAGRLTGFALADASVPAGSGSDVAVGGGVDVNLVVVPQFRRTGVGRALAEAVLQSFADVPLTAWSHGNHPGAARLAEVLGFERTRDLWVMRRPLSPEHPLPEISPAGGIVVRPFRPGEDEEAFLAVNAEAFADHPEQGGMTRDDLEERVAEPWFDPAGFFMAEPEDAPTHEANAAVESPSLLGFHWTKVHRDEHPPVGEVYVVGVSPAAQGLGLGKLLTLTGLHHLQEQGLGEVILYVEADNAPAIRVYSGLGFTHADEDTDVQYSRPARRPD